MAQNEKNSFKELEKMYINDRGKGSVETRHKIESNIHLFGFISDLIDVYLPKAVNVIQVLGTFNSSVKNKDIK